VQASKKGDVTISVPYHGGEEIAEACDHVRVYSYHPRKKTYQLAEQKDLLAQCSRAYYYQALDVAVPQTSGTTRIATIKILPSFQPDTAITFDMTSQGLEISRFVFPKELWVELSVYARSSPKLPSQCLALAKTIKLDRTVVPMDRGLAQRYIDELRKIDFTVDRCPRSKAGVCYYVLDGRSFVVQLDDGRSAQITDVSKMNGMSSQNPALSDWIARLFSEIRSAN
jgi:hypothetical protein